MTGLETAPGWGQAALLIGVVLVEAVLLYVGYGYLEEVLGGAVIERIKYT